MVESTYILWKCSYEAFCPKTNRNLRHTSSLAGSVGGLTAKAADSLAYTSRFEDMLTGSDHVADPAQPRSDNL
jgi:hypothetical protein